MSTFIGIINLMEEHQQIRELTEQRPIGSIPFAGRYRLVDFALSSMVNAKIGNVGILLSDQSRSILDHLRSGKDWDLARRHDGLLYLPFFRDANSGRKGNLWSIYHNLDFIEHSDQEDVFLANGGYVYTMDFSAVMRFHKNTQADITVVYVDEQQEIAGQGVVVKTNPDGLVKDLAKVSQVYPGMKRTLGIYLMKKSLFLKIVREAFSHGGTDFLVDGILQSSENYQIYAYQHKGYARQINSTEAYYQANMDVLQPEIWQELFMGENPVYTKIKDELPVQYKDTANVQHSLIANGCVLRGDVENSVLSRGVKVGRGAVIRNSIIMQKCVIADHACIENVICDKNVRITEGKELKGAPSYPLIVHKNIIV